ncbi:MAG TPA: hypothetical protein VNV66_12195 [Pilimelia sp.]|nr:hypothetical protein [Pilimelia sp.]
MEHVYDGSGSVPGHERVIHTWCAGAWQLGEHALLVRRFRP